MSIFYRLSTLLCLLAAATAHAEELDPAIEATNWPEPAPREAATTIVEADQVKGEAQNHVTAEGDVLIQQAGREVQADVVDLYSNPERVIARGRVRYQQEGLFLQANELDLLTAGQTGYAEGIRYSVQKQGRFGQGQAARINFVGPERYEMERARFSTCDPNQTDWYLGAQKLDLDYGRNIGVAHNSTLTFLGVPILWMPWLDFPLDGGRKSGILAPKIGISDSNFEISIPYYWNIAPNLDTTITPRFMLQRGVQLSNEIRYLTENSRGESTLEWLGSDQITGQNRYGINYEHNQRFNSMFTGGIRYQKVSDFAYFADLGDRLSAATQVTLPQEIWANYTNNHWQALLRLQRYQTLQDPMLPIAPPYWREPQLFVEGIQPLLGGLSFKLNSEWVRFKRDNNAPSGLPEQVEGQRFHFYPSVQWNLNTPYAYITPKLGWMFTDYQLDQATNTHITRNLPIMSLDSGMTFERDFKYKDDLYTQTIEPRLYYVNIPYRDQTDIPNFDTNELSFNFAQMFSENRFSGVDKVNNAKQLTVGVTSRFLESDTGNERLRLSLGQRFYFVDQQVTLDQSQNASTETKSDILLAASGTINSHLRLDSYAQFNQGQNRLERNAFTLNFQPQPGRSLNLGYHFAYPDTRQGDVSVQWPLFNQWYGMSRVLYSFRDRDVLESMGGLEYKAGCWVFRALGQRYVVPGGQKSSRLLFELELNGLGGLGNNPLRALRESIFGYQKSNELGADKASNSDVK